MERKFRIPVPKEAAEPTLSKLLADQKTEEEMYASRCGTEAKTFDEEVAISVGPLLRSAATYYTSLAASLDVEVSNLHV